MKEEFTPENLSDEDKKRMAYIEGRPDLFETKLLQISPENLNEDMDNANRILVVTRDPGSGNALLPVIKELNRDKGSDIVVMTDGRAEDIVRSNFQTTDITPKGNILTAEQNIGHPKAVLMDSSEEIGIEAYASATFPDVPKVLVEDYYTSSIDFLSKLIERGIPLPEKICVIDEGAKDILVKKFPQLADNIEITGQPIFDRFASEKTEEIAKEVKKRLGIEPSSKLVVYMSTIDGVEKAKEIANAIGKIKADFYFIFRKHPRDNVRYEEYKELFEAAGIKIMDSEEFTIDEVGAASDVVITTWSTAGIEAIYRRKPTINIVDFKYPVPKGFDFPLVPVRLGASVGLDCAEQLSQVLPELLDKKSRRNTELSKNMKKYYKADGKNAKRVACVVKKIMDNKDDEK